MSGGPSWQELEQLLEEMQALQHAKVVGLARRLRPGLTADDIKNPHDFPELDDRDWQFEDGLLTGIESVSSALRAMRKSRDA